MTTVTEEPQTEAPKAAVEKSNSELFKWSEHVHLGEGAESCQHATDGKCKEEDHFHAWICLPNPFQARDLNEKAFAAKARRTRMLRDPESDVYVILEAQLEELTDAAETEEGKSLLVDEIQDTNFGENYRRAVREVEDKEDPNWEPDEDEEQDESERPKLYETINQDREEYERQLVLPGDQRSDEYDELVKRIANYSRDIDEAYREILAPERERLLKLPVDELVKMVRKLRIERISGEMYRHTYNAWQWYACTYKPRLKGRPNEHYWPSIEVMRAEAPTDVIAALSEAFDRLETELSAGERGGGNS